MKQLGGLFATGRSYDLVLLMQRVREFLEHLAHRSLVVDEQDGI